MFHHIMVNLTGSSHKKCHLLLVKCCAFPLASQGRGLEHGRFEQGFSETGLFMMVNVYVHKCMYIYIYIHTYIYTHYIYIYIYMWRFPVLRGMCPSPEFGKTLGTGQWAR